ncbi:uncharacterized protein BDR25DRAFT_349804 [Lindgomyces ingoldianus]|uniref:Uncharacterized protein n=1 Tax=Lindgomyces ingoldianus TaxID=673940 RepID=A0ACB6RBS4_9PLEO|nr:uncharacterized protein BDR25DRAFT_349804 [Lindgomyces ingoldianus]KAF2476743.1 hypothetical protein BDR25DRAFT_349804 [Lindgomyces ingoldianus]
MRYKDQGEEISVKQHADTGLQGELSHSRRQVLRWIAATYTYSSSKSVAHMAYFHLLFYLLRCSPLRTTRILKPSALFSSIKPEVQTIANYTLAPAQNGTSAYEQQTGIVTNRTASLTYLIFILCFFSLLNLVYPNAAYLLVQDYFLGPHNSTCTWRPEELFLIQVWLIVVQNPPSIPTLWSESFTRLLSCRYQEDDIFISDVCYVPKVKAGVITADNNVLMSRRIGIMQQDTNVEFLSSKEGIATSLVQFTHLPGFFQFTGNLASSGSVNAVCGPVLLKKSPGINRIFLKLGRKHPFLT